MVTKKTGVKSSESGSNGISEDQHPCNMQVKRSPLTCSPSALPSRFPIQFEKA